MQVSVKYKFAFLCQPKCASTAIEEMLKPFSDFGSLSGRASFKHTNLKQYSQYIKPYIEQTGAKNCETVCLMREPISWLESFFKYRSRDVLKDPKHPNHHRSTANMTFNEFIEGYLEDERAPYASVGSQLDFIVDKNGKVGVDKIFAYENINDFLEYMNCRIGTDLTLPILNTSPNRVIEDIDPILRIKLEKELEDEIRFYQQILQHKEDKSSVT